MRPLVTPEYVLSWLCIYLPDATVTKSQKILHVSFTSTLLTIQTIGMAAGLMFAAKNISMELVKSLFESLISFNHGYTVYCALLAFILRKEIPNIFLHLSEIYKECKFFVA